MVPPCASALQKTGQYSSLQKFMMVAADAAFQRQVEIEGAHRGQRIALFDCSAVS
jgi:hypothetical protein